MNETEYTAEEVLQFIEENEIEAVRLSFCDAYGALRSIQVMAEELPNIFQKGKLLDTVDAAQGFLSKEGEAPPALYPDPSTLVVLPWKPGCGRVVQMLCCLKYPYIKEERDEMDQIDHVLLVSGSLNVTAMLAELLKAQGAVRISSASHGGEARRLLSQTEYSLVIINTPLEDEFGHELALLAARSSLSGVMLLAKSGTAEKVSNRVEKFGVMVVPKPVSRQMFYQALKLLQASISRMRSLKSENRKLQYKLEEIRLINRAKFALIQYLNMTEPQAHRYIEKQAMDLRITRMEVAQGILQTYDI